MLRVIENAAYIKSRLSHEQERKAREQILSDDGSCFRVSCSYCPLCSDNILDNHHCYVRYVTQNRHDTNTAHTYMFDILSRIKEPLWMQLPGTRFCGFSTAQSLCMRVWRMNGTVKPLKIFIPEQAFAKRMVAGIAHSNQSVHWLVPVALCSLSLPTYDIILIETYTVMIFYIFCWGNHESIDLVLGACGYTLRKRTHAEPRREI